MKSRWAGLPRRILTAIGLATVSLALIWSGLWFFMAEVLFLAMAASSEYFDMVERKGLRPARRLGTAAIAVWLLAGCFLPDQDLYVLAVLGFVGFLMAMPLRAAVRVSAMLDAGATWLGVGYVGWLFGFVVRVRQVQGTVLFHDMWLSRGALLVTFLV